MSLVWQDATLHGTRVVDEDARDPVFLALDQLLALPGAWQRIRMSCPGSGPRTWQRCMSRASVTGGSIAATGAPGVLPGHERA